MKSTAKKSWDASTTTIEARDHFWTGSVAFLVTPYMQFWVIAGVFLFTREHGAGNVLRYAEEIGPLLIGSYGLVILIYGLLTRTRWPVKMLSMWYLWWLCGGVALAYAGGMIPYMTGSEEPVTLMAVPGCFLMVTSPLVMLVVSVAIGARGADRKAMKVDEYDDHYNYGGHGSEVMGGDVPVYRSMYSSMPRYIPAKKGEPDARIDSRLPKRSEASIGVRFVLAAAGIALAIIGFGAAVVIGFVGLEAVSIRIYSMEIISIGIGMLGVSRFGGVMAARYM
ncbi:hypothetical protein RM531_15885 [Salinisphaera sp. P385]|uniref:Uncharacterized protein n=1 Tax=Spectribacter acetivorans TaxID=3075603 RepID=A0ABU3BCD7_9GAMM|nr:hypothetical protein [Salinisphaera sp. P385]MDT0619949.1 hypothetical protein [Salinisphaera sp. P385]